MSLYPNTSIANAGTTTLPESPSLQPAVTPEAGNSASLYIDFADDRPPPSGTLQTSEITDNALGHDQTTSPGTSVVVKTEQKIDPRQEWINSDPTKPYFCKLCDYSMDCMEAFQGHCMSAKHVKRAVEVFNIKMPKRKEDEEKKTPPQFHCQVCLITCNSDTAWNSHLLGQRHRKILEKQGAEKAQQKAQEKGFGYGNPMGHSGFGRGRGGGGPIRGGMFGPGHTRKPYDKPVHNVQQPSSSGPIGARDFATYPEPLIGLEYVTEIQVIGQSPRYHCELCDSKFDHNLKFPHLVGSKHRFNVLKEKNPEIAHVIRGDIKKRSELSSKLLEEAHKLEMQEGRNQVKTRVEKSPFNRVNNQSATNQSSYIKPLFTPTARRGGQTGGQRGGQPWQSQRGARGGGRGRGNQQGTGMQYNNYNQQQQQQQQPSYNRGGRGSGRGRGNSSRGNISRGRGSGGSNQNRSWNQDFSSDNTPNVTFSSGNYGGGNNSYQSNQGGGGRMLPPAALQPRSPPRSQGQSQYSGYQVNQVADAYYDDYYGGESKDTGYNNRAVYEYNEPYPAQKMEVQQDITPAPQQAAVAAGSTPGSTPGVSLLQGAIADLGKLVSTEEDASMALQVSNALTQALLNFRMQNLPQDGAAENTTNTES